LRVTWRSDDVYATGVNPAVGYGAAITFRRARGPRLNNSQLYTIQSISGLCPVQNYTAWWQKHTGVNNLPGVAALLESKTAVGRTRNLSPLLLPVHCASTWHASRARYYETLRQYTQTWAL